MTSSCCGSCSTTICSRMTVELLLPAAAAIVIGASAGLISWPLRPMLVARMLAVIAVVVVMTVVIVLGAIAAGFAARSALVLSLIEWCPVVPLHHQVGVFEGVLAVGGLVVVAGRTRAVLRRWHLAIEGTQGRRLAIVDSDEPVAYAAPGDPGCVVVSRALLDGLDTRERQVVLAHERAHLHLRHHRYLLTGEIAAAVIPLLRPLAGQIRLATERSADEAAAEAMEGDRRLVARTIARAALNRSAHTRLLPAFNGGWVPVRINALIGPAHRPEMVTLAVVVVSVAGGLTLVASSTQVHHLIELIEHICRR